MKQQEAFAGWYSGAMETKGRKRKPLSPEGRRKAEAIAADMMADEGLKAAFNDAYAAMAEALDSYFAEHVHISRVC
jgi:hypothetical protein